VITLSLRPRLLSTYYSTLLLEIHHWADGDSWIHSDTDAGIDDYTDSENPTAAPGCLAKPPIWRRR